MDGEKCFIWNKSLQPNKSSHMTGRFAVPFGGAPHNKYLLASHNKKNLTD